MFLYLTACCFICQKIKNPNYQGKWKAPMIDNPGMFLWNWTLYLLLFGCWVISTESNSCASQISRMIHTFMHLTAWSTLALSCGRLVLDSRIFLSRSERHHSWLILLFFYVQVKSGTLFDNIIITDDPALAKTFAEETWGKHKEVCFSSL